MEHKIKEKEAEEEQKDLDIFDDPNAELKKQ